MTYLVVFMEFFKTGLFSIGGGLATLPYLIEFAKKYDFITVKQLINMISISESTPGPLGINIATYVGFKINGVAGALITTLAITLPSYIIICIISIFYSKYQKSKLFNYSLIGIKPVVCALIFGAILQILQITFINGKLINLNFNYQYIIICLLFIGAMNIPKIKNLHPIVWIILGATLGIIFKL